MLLIHNNTTYTNILLYIILVPIYFIIIPRYIILIRSRFNRPDPPLRFEIIIIILSFIERTINTAEKSKSDLCNKIHNVYVNHDSLWSDPRISYGRLHFYRNAACSIYLVIYIYIVVYAPISTTQRFPLKIMFCRFTSFLCVPTKEDCLI